MHKGRAPWVLFERVQNHEDFAHIIRIVDFLTTLPRCFGSGQNCTAIVKKKIGKEETHLNDGKRCDFEDTAPPLIKSI